MRPHARGALRTEAHGLVRVPLQRIVGSPGVGNDRRYWADGDTLEKPRVLHAVILSCQHERDESGAWHGLPRLSSVPTAPLPSQSSGPVAPFVSRYCGGAIRTYICIHVNSSESIVNALGKAVLGIGAASLAGGLGYYFYERNTEQPNYQVILKDGRFEVRQYPALLVAETITSGVRDEALNRGFRNLAGYIFGKSRGGEKISMTAPVIQDREKIAMTAPVLQEEAGTDGWRTRFIMPASYTRASLPPPPEGVSISELPSRRLAAMRFSGRANDAVIADHESELRRWIAARHLHSIGPAEYAFYNSPFIPPFMRRNEILIPVRP